MWSKGLDRRTDSEWIYTAYSAAWKRDTLLCNGVCLQWFRGYVRPSCIRGSNVLDEFVRANTELIRSGASNNPIKPPAD